MAKLIKKLGNVAGLKSPVKTWRENKGDFNAAAVAAAYYSKRDGKEYAIVRGNSYMHLVFHICEEKKIDSMTTDRGTFNVGMSFPNGDIYLAEVTI